jgi:hypothetical protein
MQVHVGREIIGQGKNKERWMDGLIEKNAFNWLLSLLSPTFLLKMGEGNSAAGHDDGFHPVFV